MEEIYRKNGEPLLEFNKIYVLKEFYETVPYNIGINHTNFYSQRDRLKFFYETETVLGGIRKTRQDIILKDYKFKIETFDDFLELIKRGKIPTRFCQRLIQLFNGEVNDINISLYLYYLKLIKNIDYSPEAIEKLSKLPYYDIKSYHFLRKIYKGRPVNFNFYELIQEPSWKYMRDRQILHELQEAGLIKFEFHPGQTTRTHILHELLL